MGGFGIQPFQIQQPNLSNMVIQANQIKQQRRQFEAEAQQRQIKFQQQEFKNGIERMKTFGAIFGAVIPNDPDSYKAAIDQVTTMFGQKDADRILEQLPEGRDRMSAADVKRVKTQFRGLIGDLKEQEKQFTLKPGEVRFDPTGEPIAGVPAAQKQPTPTPITKLLNERDALRLGDPRRSILDRAIKKATSTRTTTTDIDPATGQIKITEGFAGQGLQRPTKTGIEKDLLTATKGLSRLNRIEQTFNEKFLEAPTRLGFEINTLTEKIKGRQALTQAEKAEAIDISKFRQDAISNLNLYIKEITGAQMSEAEANRLRQGVPDPGNKGITGILSGDSPTVFKAKLDNSILQLKMATARLNYMRKQGLEIKPRVRGIENTLSLNEMPSIMANREAEIEQTIRQQMPGIQQQELDNMILRQLAEEFGLVSGF